MSAFDENINFVLMVERFINVLEKSQEPSAKKKKEESITLFIEEWRKVSGTELTAAALLKN